jgi:hypothetical protein
LPEVANNGFLDPIEVDFIGLKPGGIDTRYALIYQCIYEYLRKYFAEGQANECCPNGILAQSPGLRGTRYPGKTSEENHNPNGVVAVLTRAPKDTEWPQPRCGWNCLLNEDPG